MTDDEIDAVAQNIYLAKATAEAKSHNQNITPWGELGETFKESLRAVARDILTKENPA